MTETAPTFKELLSGLSLDELMKFDSIAEAENMAKIGIIDNNEIDSVGISLHLATTQLLRSKLQDAGDTNSSTTFSELQTMLKIEGFEELVIKTFEEEERWGFRDGDSQKMQYIDYREKSKLFVYWNNELNILLYGTTYPSYEKIASEIVFNKETINSINMCYTLKKPNDMNDKYNLLSSYGTYWNDSETESFIVGSHDIRKAFLSTLSRLKDNFEFTKWEGKQHLWLLHYMQHRTGMEYNSKEINAEIISEFPQHVVEAMNGKYYQ